MAAAPSAFAREMAFYSAYHQQRTNIWIHVFGVPIILFSAYVPLAAVTLTSVGGWPVTLAGIYFVLTSIYYLRLDLGMGLIASAFYGALCVAAHGVSPMGPGVIIAVFLGGQILGWTSQIYGHLHFERNRPAFYENIVSSFVSAPLFVVADVLFHLGFKQELQDDIRRILADTGRLRDFDSPTARPASG